jgi:hypothetical protein
MLETEKKGQEDWNLIVKPVKWCFVIFVFSVERPDIGSDKIDIILSKISRFSVWVRMSGSWYIVAEPSFSTGKVMLQVFPVTSLGDITTLMGRGSVNNILILRPFLKAPWRIHCKLWCCVVDRLERCYVG